MTRVGTLLQKDFMRLAPGQEFMSKPGLLRSSNFCGRNIKFQERRRKSLARLGMGDEVVT